MNLNRLDFNKLDVFSKIVEAGNYRKASEILNVTPSALSQTVSVLEHSLGVPLFHRIGKKMVVTETGEKIHREFRRHHLSLTEALGRLSQDGDQVGGLIRIGAYLEFAKFQLAPILTSFQKVYPDTQVKLNFETPSRLQALLESNKLDVCFSIYPVRDSQVIQSQPIFKEELLLVSKQGHFPSAVTFEDVMASPMVEYYFNHQPIRRWLALHFKKKPKHLPIRTFGATAEMVLALVKEGMGIGVVPEYLLQFQSCEHLSICRPTSRKLMDHIWMLQLKSVARSPAVAAFLKHATAQLKGI